MLDIVLSHSGSNFKSMSVRSKMCEGLWNVLQRSHLHGTVGKSFTSFSQITETVYRCGLQWSSQLMEELGLQQIVILL